MAIILNVIGRTAPKKCLLPFESNSQVEYFFVCSIPQLSSNKRRVRIYDMDADEDEETDQSDDENQLEDM